MRLHHARNPTDTDDGTHWLLYEKSARKQGFKRIAGVDEAGRGPLAGPVAAAACIIPSEIILPNINDSKKLTAVQRQNLYDTITTHPEILFAIATVDNTVIDEINILQATVRAMLSAVNELNPDYVLVDGLKLPHPTVPTEKIVKGDTLSQSIAAASILAKVTRDRLMLKYHERWPMYGFDRHKGYGTQVHLEALAQHGPCEIHRLSFAPVRTP